MNKIIYLDYAATAPVYPAVVKAMEPYFTKIYGNPGSPHLLGEEARKTLDNAREVLAKTINAKPWEIVFTSGASESNSLALQGLASAYLQKRKIIISAFEHASIYETCQEMKKRGYIIVEIPVSKEGLIDIKKLEASIDDKTLVVSVIHGHNEIGVLQDIGTIGEICKERGVFFHTDAVQSFGKEQIDVQKMKIGLLSATAHKIGGPKGIGLLYLREGIMLKPFIVGGGQEKGFRAGTENVAGAVGFSCAVNIVRKEQRRKIEKLRNYFMQELEKIGGRINGSREKRLAGNIHVSFPEIDAELLVSRLSHEGIMCSTRSACSEKEKNDHRILNAINLDKKAAFGSIRLTFGEKTTKKDIENSLRSIRKFVTS